MSSGTVITGGVVSEDTFQGKSGEASQVPPLHSKLIPFPDAVLSPVKTKFVLPKKANPLFVFEFAVLPTKLLTELLER